MIPITEQRINDYLMGLSRETDPLVLRMEEEGRERGFPIVDRLVGRLLYVLTALRKPRLVVEMGSGFGYSAYWFARALPKGGKVVLTDYSEENIASARETFRKAGMEDRAEFNTGDAFDTARSYRGIDILFIDLEKRDYPRAAREMLPNLAADALLIADNSLWYGRVADSSTDPDTLAIREFNEYMFSLEDFFTIILPLRDGVLVSYRLS